ncbi:hypothetical protein V5799_028060 [Amblyomma americanum]|uniref:Secreted protein n=1 Tax=Amblyomma americanum TaxID=6943 RepID=A0AAQ4DDY2_AMBAM
MKTLALAVACFLVAGVHCGAVFTYGVPAAVVHAPVVHTPVMNQAVVRAPVVAEHKELVHAPHHEYGYTVEHNKLVHPKSTVVHHDPLTGRAGYGTRVENGRFPYNAVRSLDACLLPARSSY